MKGLCRRLYLPAPTSGPRETRKDPYSFAVGSESKCRDSGFPSRRRESQDPRQGLTRTEGGR